MGRKSRPAAAALLPDHASGPQGAGAATDRMGAVCRGGQSNCGGLKMRNWRAEVRHRLDRIDIAPPRLASIAEELGLHLEQRYDRLIAEGVPSDEADRAVLQELSDSDV